MDISGVGLTDLYSNIPGTQFQLPVQETGNQSGCSGRMEQMDISISGKLMGALSRMSEDEREEMKTFHTELLDAVTDGTFNTSEMAASAPEALVEFAEENGVDLEQMIEDMASGPQANKGAPPPPPMMGGIGGIGESELSDEEKEEMDAFMEDLIDSINSGTFDASEMAANAPEALVQFAEENGVDLEQMIESMASGPHAGKGAPPPPPPMYSSRGAGLSLMDEQDGESLSELLLSDEGDEISQASAT